MILGIDLDGCAYPFTKNFASYLRVQGFDIPEEWEATHWDFYEDFGLTVPEFVEYIEKGIADRHMFINDDKTHLDYPEPGFSNVMNFLRGQGHKIHIITHRNAKGASAQTIEWIDRYKIPYDALHFVRDKTIVKVDLLLDDSPHNWSQSVRSGIPCIIFHRPYNSHLNGTTVADWDEFYHIIGRIDSGELAWNGHNRFVNPKDLVAIGAV